VLASWIGVRASQFALLAAIIRSASDTSLASLV
jgi:hypothetical protein